MATKLRTPIDLGLKEQMNELDLTEEQRRALTYGSKLRFAFPEKVVHLFDPQSEESLLF